MHTGGDHPDSSNVPTPQTPGPEAKLEDFLPLVYDQLRRAAENSLKSERANHTLQATALVHEAYVKLMGPREVPWQSRGHFYSAAAQAMRQILLDHAKARNAHKRGGGAARVNLEDATISMDGGSDPAAADNMGADFIALDNAIARLEGKDPRAAQVVRLRFYAGLEIAQIALALEVSERTVKNDWAFAKAWMQREIRAAETRSTHPEPDHG
jgi:RNA polymerase sigma factor (TIGR02999 family)